MEEKGSNSCLKVVYLDFRYRGKDHNLSVGLEKEDVTAAI